jgi:hypothetical protein
MWDAARVSVRTAGNVFMWGWRESDACASKDSGEKGVNSVSDNNFIVLSSWFGYNQTKKIGRGIQRDVIVYVVHNITKQC